jgi:mRNA interferase RelE/StbE
VGNYSVEFKKSAEKELYALDDRVLLRIVQKIELLAQNPRPSGCKKLKAFHDQWRIRVGDYRVVYTIDDAATLISITRIRHRGAAYE